MEMHDVVIKAKLMDERDLDRTLTRMARQIMEYFEPENGERLPLALIGMQTRGVFLAQRLQSKIREADRIDLPLGALDVTMYRDDIRRRSQLHAVGVTNVPFDISDRQVILIDDVLYTGRTARAAMDALTDLGRPAIIRFLVMIDREHHELPIRADMVGRTVPTIPGEEIHVRLREIDDKEGVWLVERQ